MTNAPHTASSKTYTDEDIKNLVDTKTGKYSPEIYTSEELYRCCHVNLSAIGEGIALVGSGDVRSRFPDIKCLQPMEADG